MSAIPLSQRRCVEAKGRDGMSALALRRCLGVRRPAVSDRARSLEEVIAVERPGLSSLRPSASRYAILYLPVKGIPASLELGRAVRIPRRRCWPVRESACRKQQCSDRRKRSRQTTFTHFLSPLKPTPCQRQREPTPAGAPSSTVRRSDLSFSRPMFAIALLGPIQLQGRRPLTTRHPWRRAARRRPPLRPELD